MATTVVINSSYARTIPGIFKCVEGVLDLLLLILSGVWAGSIFYIPGIGWLIFVSIMTLFVSLFFYCVHLTNFIYRLQGPLVLLEFVFIVVCAVFHLIAMIVAAAYAYYLALSIAVAVFFGISTIIYGIDAFFLFALYRVNGAYMRDVSNEPTVGGPAGVIKPGATNYGYQ